MKKERDQAREKRDELRREIERLRELLTEAAAAIKPLALLAVPPEGPIAHMNTRQEITLADIERAVGFVSKWRESSPWSGEGG